MRPSLPSEPGWCEGGSGEPPLIALGRHTGANSFLLKYIDYDEKHS